MDRFATPRLIATRLARADLADLAALHLDAEVSRFLGGVRTPEATAAYLETNIRHWDERGFGLWTLRAPSGVYLGRAGLRYVQVEGVEELEIAYALAQPAWGQGLATEIARKLVEIWETRLSDPSLVGLVVKGNAPSEQVLLKTGFVYQRDAVFHASDCSLFRRRRL